MDDVKPVMDERLSAEGRLPLPPEIRGMGGSVVRPVAAPARDCG